MSAIVEAVKELDAKNKDLKDDLEYLYHIVHGLEVRRGFEPDHPIVLELREKLRKFEDKHGIENGVFGKKLPVASDYRNPHVLDTRPSSMAGSYRIGTLYAAPSTVAKTLGLPTVIGGDEKVDREWMFDFGGSIYAYKATSNYEPDCPTPEEFWASNEEFPLSICGNRENYKRALEGVNKMHMGKVVPEY